MSQKEAEVYLALLELGSAKVSDVSKPSSINRSSAYVVLETLKKRGLVGISNDKNIKRYIAASPEVLLHTASTSVQKQENIKTDIESALPELKALSRNTKSRPVVQVFEGKEGLINCFEDSLKCENKLMRVTSAPANIGKIVYDYMPIFIKKKSKAWHKNARHTPLRQKTC